MPATGLTTPATVKAPDWPAVRTQDAPESVTVRVVPVTALAAEQLEYPPPVKVTVGVGGSENPVGRTAVIVSPLRSALVAVKPTDQVERALPVWGEPANETALGADAARIVTEAALPAVVSAVVLTVSTDAPGEVFVMPAIVSEAGVLGGRAHEPPLSTRVMVATAPAPVAVAEQFTKPAPSTIVGVAGTEKPGVNVTVIWSPAFSAPLAVGVKFTVQVARA